MIYLLIALQFASHTAQTIEANEESALKNEKKVKEIKRKSYEKIKKQGGKTYA